MSEKEKYEKYVSPDEMKLLQAIRIMGLEPKLESPDDLVKLSKVFTGAKAGPHKEADDKPPPKHQYPKFSIFYGEENKGEVSWDTLRFEIKSSIHDEVFSHDQILFGIRRCLKGHAADKLRRLGTEVELEQVLDYFESAYGTVQTRETIMKKFYTCEQKASETVESYSSRLEELFDKAVELKALHRTDTEILKQVLHSGLKKELKHMSVYQNDKLTGYEEFKHELRKIEADLKEKPEEKKPCNPAVPTESKASSEVTELLKKLNDRIDKLEQGQQQHHHQQQRQQQQQQQHYHQGYFAPQQQEFQFRFPGQHPWKGPRRGRGARGRGYNGGRGRDDYRPQRPTGSRTMTPACFICGERDHIQIDCPKIMAQFTCTRCKQKGHLYRDCPN